MARAVVIPSLFEAASAPLWEAWRAGTPVACSNVTSLPEQAGAAAIVFDPHDLSQIAAATLQLWTEDDVRNRLIAAGRERVGSFTWLRTARIFRAHYRRLAGRDLTADDRELIDAATSF